jgi:hypothetical protein
VSGLADKIAGANRIIDAVLMEFRNPAVMWSSGKDSMVLLYLLRARCTGPRFPWPVIWHREPWGGEKYEFGERMVREWGLRIYDWAPAMVTLMEANGHVSLVNHYQVSGGMRTCALPIDIYEPKTFKGDFVCGLKDVLHRPTGGFKYPWDVVLHGHKSSDVDPILGPVPLNQEIAFNEGAPAAAFPLASWTDADIWEYTARYGVPQQLDRYNQKDGTENPDRTRNPDYFAGCVRCIDRSQGKSVFCPKLKTTVNNISKQVAYTEPIRPDYITKEGGQDAIPTGSS